ncbi:MAG TPA: hypothetical protein VF077_07340 [Nitrospiraceae bacterium]
MVDKWEAARAAVPAAALNDDLDSACLMLQRIMGIETGDVASHVFSDTTGKGWRAMDAVQRELRLYYYVKTERNFADDE